MNEITTIDAYIAQFPINIQKRLIQVRTYIRETAPNAKEKISWGMPTFTYNGNLIHFAAHKKHLGVYPGPEAIERFAKELQSYVCSKGAIQFPYTSLLPKELICKIVLFCVSLHEE